MSSSTPGVPISTTAAVPTNRRQKRMGPAPFASFEDLSDELDSPEDKNTTGSVVRLPGIREDITPCSPTPSPAPVADTQRSPQFVYTGISLIGAPSTPTMNAPPPIPQSVQPLKSHPAPIVRQVSLCAPSAPRIDISRASSSSHHDSKESSPERELFDAAQDAVHTAKVSLGFKEDGAVDLRSSTEELAYQDAADKHKSSHKHHQFSTQSQQQQQQRSQSPGLVDDSYHSHQRKDSQSSELGLLCISGRTSRLSSIGSQGSAHSRISTASHLSVISGQSGTSRSPSPHKMLLETSFCGIKPNDLVQKAEQQYGTKAVEPEELEKLILKRQHDPTQAILAEGMAAVSPVDTKKKESSAKVKTPPEKPARKMEKQVSPKSDITINVEKPRASEILPAKAKLPRTIVAPSGVEYIYIPLRGPMPEGSDTSGTSITKTKVRETKSATLNSKQLQSTEMSKGKSKSASPSPVVQRQYQGGHGSADGPIYIRIKLKPDYMYSQEDKDQSVEIQKPVSLDLHDKPKKSSQPFEQIIQLKPEPIIITRHTDNQMNKITPTKSPKPTRHLKDPIASSKSPSPSLSRKSSFASLFKSRETMSPESPSAPSRRKLSNSLRDDKDRRRSRSKSRDRDRSLPPSSTESIDSKGKPKSVFSIFKSKTKRDDADHPNLEILAHELKSMDNTPVKKALHLSRSPQRYNETQLQGESIRIPLHSPTYYEQKLFLQDTKTSSLDSQETVIEATPNKQPDSIIETGTTEVETHTQPPKPSIIESNRQSSSSSDNIVFSTKLGSSNDLFTTKIPKDPKKITENGNIHIEMAIVECNKPPSRLLKQERQQDAETEQEIKVQEIEKVEKIGRSKPSTPPMPRDSSFSSPISRELSPSSDVSKGKGLITSKSGEDMEKLRRSPVEREICRITTIEKIETPKTIHKDFSKPSSMKVTPTKEQATTIEVATSSSSAKVPTTLDLRKSIHDDDYHCSSESEKESEKDFKLGKSKNAATDEPAEVETERKGLVMQQDSFEDEFPYVPTTLPQERSVAVPIVPVKQRSTFEMKTCPIERPRSSTPINPSCLEDYCEEVMGNIDVDKITKTIEKLKISLPKDEADRPPKTKSPRRTNSSNWFDFSAMGIQQKRTTPQEVEPEAAEPEPTPPPLPPKGVQTEWINFEEIPERRKPPKRIQTIPSRGHIDVPEAVRQHHRQSPQEQQPQQQQPHQVVYTYVNPEDCKCECHEQQDRQRHHHHRSRDRERDTRDVYSREQERCGEMRTPDRDKDHCSSRAGHRKGTSPVSGDDSPSADASEALTGVEEVGEDEMPLLDDEPDIDMAQAHTSGVTKLSKGDGQLKLDVTVLNRRSLVSESSVDLSVNVEQPDPVCPEQILQTPFTSDLGVSSNRSSIISQDDSQSPPESQSPNAFTKST